MITIELDLTNILVAAVASLVSIVGSAFVTWYFSKRHYERVSQPVTENDIILRDNENGFRFAVIFVILVFSCSLVILLAMICSGPRIPPEGNEVIEPTSGYYHSP